MAEPTPIPPLADRLPGWLNHVASVLQAFGIERPEDLFMALPFLFGVLLFAYIARAERKRTSNTSNTSDTKGDPS